MAESKAVVLFGAEKLLLHFEKLLHIFGMSLVVSVTHLRLARARLGSVVFCMALRFLHLELGILHPDP